MAKLRVGDVICLPLSEELFGFGQIVDSYDRRSGGFLMAVFDCKTNKPKSISLSSICRSEVIFLGFTFDSKLFHKQWFVIGNYTENLSSIKKPYYKLGTPPDEIYLIDFNNNILSKIPESLFSNLEYKTEIAPMRYENALKAYFGLAEWKVEDYNKLLYENVLNSNELASKILSEE